MNYNANVDMSGGSSLGGSSLEQQVLASMGDSSNTHFIGEGQSGSPAPNGPSSSQMVSMPQRLPPQMLTQQGPPQGSPQGPPQGPHQGLHQGPPQGPHQEPQYIKPGPPQQMPHQYQQYQEQYQEQGRGQEQEQGQGQEQEQEGMFASILNYIKDSAKSSVVVIAIVFMLSLPFVNNLIGEYFKQGMSDFGKLTMMGALVKALIAGVIYLIAGYLLD